MTHYYRQVSKLVNDCYPNKGQLDTIIGTRHYINNHLNKELKLDFLSKVRFISKFHLLRLFKKYYGQTPKQYIIDKRIEQAKLLLQGGKTVTDTCFEVGFDTPSSFSTLFKSRVGLTPNEFRKRAIFTKSDCLAFKNFAVLNVKPK
ncbi:helix-turn-helix domain-containing protein [Flagellimonas olearia]|uniref:Helix-turn-helix domain-containing protein n=1 Tax=Flagellimonas olearia TaxID=552546 RepID=A0A6I1E3E4_9FLAO|nr:helix-turn-helix domain-containing protein [Allomuricauda olearia]